MSSNLITWFKTAPDSAGYQLLGILNEYENAPGIVISCTNQRIDYNPPAQPDGQMQMFNIVPESVAGVNVAEVPSLSYARQRPDWMEGVNKWKTQDNVTSAVEDLLSQNTLTPNVNNVE